MRCPVCKEPMLIIEHEAVEVDCCAACGGIWLDAGELELLFGDAEACAVAHSVVGGEWGLGEWQGAAGGDHAVIADDDGAIVER